MKTILCIGTLDTKGPEIQYIKQMIERKRGFKALVMDIGGQNVGTFYADITAEEVAGAGGSDIRTVRAITESGPAMKIMTVGAIRIAKDLFQAKKFQGVISAGGGTGTSVASAIMRELPIGLPKLMLVSQKIVQAGIRKYVGTKDILVMPSVADIAGLNSLTMDALNKAVGAIIGMMETVETIESEKDLIFMSMNGLTTGSGLKIQSTLEVKGYEVAVFHSIGVGGETFEELIKSFPVKAVIELALNEVGNELLGGLASAGPNRLEAAGEKGIPQVVTPGSIDIINFLGPETLPERYKDRTIAYHNPQATLPRVNSEEMKIIAQEMARKLNMAKGEVRVLIPTRGFSSLDRKGNSFYDPEADKTFVDSLKGALNKNIPVKEIDAHVNDEKFARAVVKEFLGVVDARH